MLVDLCPTRSFFDRFLNQRLMEMMTTNETGPLIPGKIGGRTEILPDPFLVCIPILAIQGRREIDRSKTICEIFLMESFHMMELKL